MFECNDIGLKGSAIKINLLNRPFSICKIYLARLFINIYNVKTDRTINFLPKQNRHFFIGKSAVYLRMTVERA